MATGSARASGSRTRRRELRAFRSTLRGERFRAPSVRYYPVTVPGHSVTVRLKPDSTHSNYSNRRRAFALALLVAGLASQWPNAQQAPPFDLEEATIAALQRRMETGQDTARSLTEK